MMEVDFELAPVEQIEVEGEVMVSSVQHHRSQEVEGVVIRE